MWVAWAMIPKGAYSLYSVPREKERLLIFNTDLKPGPPTPTGKRIFVSVVIPVEKTQSVKEQFTIEIAEAKNGGILSFHWDNVKAIAAFEIMRK
ncbi:MAG: DUF2911 domain-containing protein [Saprospiraceae bacterium]|nr:DUF2911 domain-containing protein [Saprospiraceae bacterium]